MFSFRQLIRLRLFRPTIILSDYDCVRQFLNSVKKEASDFQLKDEEDAEEREKGKDGKDDKSAKKDKENKLELDNGIKSILEGTSNWQA